MSSNPKLSVALATHNEAANLGCCLRSVQSLQPEIIVVDGESSDETVAIARSFGAKVVKAKNHKNFHINKQKALDEASGEWVLNLDADEEVTPQLAREIKKVVMEPANDLQTRILPAAKKRLFARHQRLVFARDGVNEPVDGEIVGLFVPRVNVFLGHRMRYGGVYPDGVIRLVRRDKARFPVRNVHEQIRCEGRVSWLQHDLLHHDSPTFAKYIMRANRYTSLTAQELWQANVRLSMGNDLFYLWVKPALIFCSLFFRHRGYKDGFAGFVWALFSGLHYALAYMKLGDLYRERRS